MTVLTTRIGRWYGAFGLISMICIVGALLVRPGVGQGQRFAGYTSARGVVTSIGANWVVPGVGGGSRLGKASTWIGAAAFSPGVSSQTAPFIQVGTQEELDSEVLTTGPAPQTFDVAFWSDTAQDFHPTQLFPVEPGDQISASLRHVGQRWIVTIRDHDTSQHISFATRQEGTARTNNAQWLQEDVTNAKTNGAFPYPALGPMRMSALTVNTIHPSARSLFISRMVLPGGTLAPSPVKHDAFTVPGRP